MKDKEPEENAPFEWWEEIQVDLLESIGMDVSSIRKNPIEWRKLRQQLNDHIAKNKGPED